MTATTLPSAPARMKGRRRPQVERLWSDKMPHSACISSATMRVPRRIVPK